MAGLQVGNHSAGKSSFINWYVQEKVQKAGVALETSGFTFVCSGKKRSTLTGEATIRLYPHMDGLNRCAGVANCIRTEIVESTVRSFPMVTFIDTPGLIDNNIDYPYDVDAALLWLARSADLVFVFLDPMGQALCKHLMNVTEQMCSDPESNYAKMNFYLSKADTAGSASDRQKVVVQMAKELYGTPSMRPGMAKLGAHASLQTIFIPDVAGAPKTDCPNHIDEVCTLLDKTIRTTVQDTLNKLKKDTDNLVSLIETRLRDDEQAKTDNLWARLRGIFYTTMGLLLPLLLLLVAAINAAGQKKLEDVVSAEMAHQLTQVGGAVYWVYDLIPEDNRWYFNIGLGTVCLMMWLYGRYVWSIKPRLTSAQKEQFKQNLQYVKHDVEAKYQRLYSAYLDGAVGADHKL